MMTRMCCLHNLLEILVVIGWPIHAWAIIAIPDSTAMAGSYPTCIQSENGAVEK